MDTQTPMPAQCDGFASIWEEQRALEAQVSHMLRRAFFEEYDDGSTPAAIARRVGTGRQAIQQSARTIGYHWRAHHGKKPEPKKPKHKPIPARPKPRGRPPVSGKLDLPVSLIVEKLRAALPEEKRRTYDRAVQAGMRPAYALRDAMGVQA